MDGQPAAGQIAALLMRAQIDDIIEQVAADAAIIEERVALGGRTIADDMLARFLGRSSPLRALAMRQLWQGVGNFLSTSLVGPLVTIALTLVYYDQRVRREGFDLQLMMAALQPGSKAQAATGATN